MIDSILALIAPHCCLSCSRLGYLLCAACCTEIIGNREPLCIGCGKADERGICQGCVPGWLAERAFVLGERSGPVRTLVDDFKFIRKRAAYRDVARLVAALLPYGVRAIIIPLPTIAAHVRQRGYDHTALVARRIAKTEGLTYAPLLRRHGRAVQHGASKRDRLRQISGVFSVKAPLDPDTLYIVFDDITTTGASLKEAVRCLREAGASRIWVLAVMRQPLDGQR